MTLHMVTCPLCCQPGFGSSEALCSALVFASTRKLFCPVCNEVVIGLDKLTIHLFGHNLVLGKPETPMNGVREAPRHSVPSHPVMYFQSDNGQLFAVATSSLLNQFGAVTINTQNFISNTSVSSHNETKLNTVVEPTRKETTEFSSCKDLLTSGDFSVGCDDTEIIDVTHQTATAIQQSSHTDPELNVNIDDASKNLVPCDFCEMSFSNKAILAVHKQLLHKKQTLSGEDGLPENGERPKKKPLTCNWCSSTFNLKSSLHIHVKVTHPAQKDAFELQRKDPEKLSCPVCGKTFPKESTLQQHMRSVHGEKLWQCTVCSKSFTTKYFLRKHKRIHTGETPYECEICHKLFTFQQSYHKHMLYHNDNKPYCCSHCGRLFKELSTLNNHERIHSGEKPFSCETCGKSFRQRVSYLVHRRIHTGAMPYKCTACNKSFRYKISQRTHKCPEHPPGVVVKTQVSLIDRLQAVISKEEEKLQQSANLSPTSADACSQLPTLSQGSLPRIGDQCQPTTSSGDCHATSVDPCSTVGSHVRGTFAGSDDTNNSSDCVSNIDNVTCGAVAPSRPDSTACSIMPPHEFNLQDMIFNTDVTEPTTDQSTAFSPGQNLDLSPSECLDRLHISSSNHNSQDSSNETLHQAISFDNMDDLDLCNLLFDIP
ncbi:hypothetical protein GE061_018405 [Apolygus lucorum]|uniref:C2H2-type domain-containing protein n=1 Tax=Apolygus lucorum TaxID=248454 RepID=A0A8S9XGH2_APOLU|nr:hypothetical protein GE061_018405 [Apolygus lucorum]